MAEIYSHLTCWHCYFGFLGLLQLIHHLTRGSAIFDLVLCEHNCDIKFLPNFNTSDHVALMVSVPLLSMSNDDLTSPHNRYIRHWKRGFIIKNVFF